MPYQPIEQRAYLGPPYPVLDKRPVMWEDPNLGVPDSKPFWQTGTEIDLQVEHTYHANKLVLVRLSFSHKLVLVEKWRLRDRPMNPS